MKKTKIYSSFAALALFGFSAHADTISPSSYSATIAVGGTASLHKTVTISQVSTSPLDVFFLTDTTGSMGGAIGNVSSNFSTIVSNVAAVSSNVAYGVGQYKDVGDPFIYNLDQDITLNTAAVQTAINSWGASGGGDTPEANLYALAQAASTTGWRDDSRRLLFWSGDATGHDPSSGVTEANAIAALTAAGVEVYGVNVGNLDGTGQATRITDATGGELFTGFSGDLSDIIIDAITSAVVNYGKVELTVEGLAGGVDVAFNPLSYVGTYDRSIDRNFGFDVTFTGLTPGTYDFNIVARVDGKIVATEKDSITVTGETPEPSTYMMLGAGFIAIAAYRRKRN